MWAVVTPKSQGTPGLILTATMILGGIYPSTIRQALLKRKIGLKLFGTKENHRKKRGICAICFAVLEKLQVQFLLCSSGQQKLIPLKPTQSKISI